MKFRVNRKTGVITNDPHVTILDRDGLPFYNMENVEPGFRFNLPKGEYYSDNNLMAMTRPWVYRLPALKPRYCYMLPPLKFRILYGPNPNKCSVDLRTGTVIFDNSFKDFPRFIKAFIKYHELGHYRYSGRGQESERDCDDFAARRMVIEGFNPSQADVASKYTLDNNIFGKDRKENTYSYLHQFKMI